MNNFFFQTKIKSKINNELITRAKHFNEWINYFNFKLMPLEPEIIQKDSFLKELNNRHPFKCGVLLLPPMTYYDWHVDDERGVCVNVLLNNEGRSFCCFSAESIKMSGSFTELMYPVGEYIIFNNQMRHCVFNFDEGRYLFTIEFNEKKEFLNYEMLIKTFEEITNVN